MPPQSSLSSTTIPSASSDPVDGLKKFACSWQGCGKSFSRSEHLHRHALNHKEGNNTCVRCAAHFRRRDLLDRHMIRHKEKDDEAGGEGLGHLATRKRLWRDTDGNIVNARRPYRQEGASQQVSLGEESGETDALLNNASSNTRGTDPPSTLTSIPSAGTRVMEQYEAPGLLQDTWRAKLDPLQSTWANDSYDFLCNADWGNQQYQNDMLPACDLPYDDIFKPDTAMSFNNTFTTLGYYDWLFESNKSNSTDSALVSILSQSQGTASGGMNSTISSEQVYYPSTNMQLHDEHHAIINSPGISTTFTSKVESHNNIFNLPTQQPGHRLGSPSFHNKQYFPTPTFGRDVVPGSESSQFGSTDYTPSSSAVSDLSDLNSSNACDNAVISASLSSHDWSSSAKSSTSQTSSPAGQSLKLRNGQPLPDGFITPPGSRLPVISSEARGSLMQEIAQSHPTRPNGSEISSSDPLLSLSSLQHYSDLFFTRFNSSYPLIHQVTFDSNNVHNFLLMSILLLGATYSDKEAHLLAVCIHDIMRPLIHSSKEFSTRPELWMLQTILLVECFGKSRAGEKQHDMSHLYHGLLINLIRKSDCQTAYVAPYDERIHDLEEHWRLSVDAEQKRRLAMLCFMWDTQHAVLFSQSLCMNASELKLTLPWDNAVWEAPSATEWLRLSQNVPPPPQYLSILKMYTKPSTSDSPLYLNALSRVLIFHGLMSVSWDLSRRDQTSLSLSITSSSIPWQLRMAECYSHWKSDFEVYASSVLSSLSFDPKHQAKFQRFSVANMAIYHTAQLILDVDINDLQIHAGARHIIGRPVTDADRIRSKARIEKWITRDAGKCAGNATWHAARLFRDGVRKLENWNVDEMFHYPWCLYLAALTCWTFRNAALQRSPSILPKVETMIRGSTSKHLGLTASTSIVDEETALAGHTEDSDDEDGDWDARVEMNALISAHTKLDSTNDNFAKESWEVGRRYKTQGLLRCIVKQLNTVRWAVVREGMIVLRSLVH